MRINTDRRDFFVRPNSASLRLFELFFRIAVFEGIVIIGKFKNIAARALELPRFGVDFRACVSSL